jgi:hypothetical protein
VSTLPFTSRQRWEAALTNCVAAAEAGVTITQPSAAVITAMRKVTTTALGRRLPAAAVRMGVGTGAGMGVGTDKRVGNSCIVSPAGTRGEIESINRSSRTHGAWNRNVRYR